MIPHAPSGRWTHKLACDTATRGEDSVKVVIWKSPRLCVPFLKRLFRFGREK